MKIQSDTIYRVIQSPTSFYYAVLVEGSTRVETYFSQNAARRHHGHGLKMLSVDEPEFEVAVAEELSRRQSDEEKKYLVHRPCGEVFDSINVAWGHANSGDCQPNDEWTQMDLDDWSVLPESEAM